MTGPEHWTDQACYDDDPERWFPTSAADVFVDPLREACAVCPRRDECLDYALDHNIRYGVWGGMIDAQRERINRGRTTAAAEWERFRRRKAEERNAQRREMAAARREQIADTRSADLALAVQIVKDTAERHGLLPEEVTGHSSVRSMAPIRHQVMLQIRQETNLSLPDIGAIFGRDHTTVLAAVRKRTA